MKRPNSEITARTDITNQTNPLPAWLPFGVLLGGAVVLLIFWENIPDRWATHWGLRGEPDGWTNKSVIGVFLPIGMGLLLCAFLEMMARTIARSNKASKEFNVSPEAVAILSAATANIVRLTSLGLAAMMSVVAVALPLYQPRTPILVISAVFLFTIPAFLIGLRTLWREHRSLKERGLLGDIEGWNGITYSNSRDERLWVPKPFGYGYTINLGHRWGWPLLLIFMVVPALVIIAIVLAMR